MNIHATTLALTAAAAAFVSTVSAFADFKPSHAFVATKFGPERQQCSSTQQYLVADDADDSDGGSSSSSMFDLSSLNSRLKEVQEKEQILPLVVLDSMVPRQVLTIQVNNALMIELVRERVAKESPFFGMLGMARLANGQQVPMTHGVEVQILEEQLQFFSEGKGVKMVLRATERRFEIEKGSIETTGGGYTEAKVQFLDSAREEEEEEVKRSVVAARRKNNDVDGEAYDRTSSLARAIMKAEEFTIPNGNIPNHLSLVNRWIELARSKEHSPGQIDGILEDVGEIPPSDQPSERALWIGALINPLPGMGVALEIRPALLTAKKAEERVEVALNGILRSIKYMDGSSERHV